RRLLSSHGTAPDRIEERRPSTDRSSLSQVAGSRRGAGNGDQHGAPVPFRRGAEELFGAGPAVADAGRATLQYRQPYGMDRRRAVLRSVRLSHHRNPRRHQGQPGLLPSILYAARSQNPARLLPGAAGVLGGAPPSQPPRLGAPAIRREAPALVLDAAHEFPLR